MFGLFKKKNHADDAHAKALEILKEIGALKTLALLHKEALLGNVSDSEINDLVLGAYRTVTIGAGITVSIMKQLNTPREESSKAYWSFINDSSIRKIASSLFESLQEHVTIDMPASVMETEADNLIKSGFKVHNHYMSNNIESASSEWLLGAKGVKADSR